ncbi:MAG: M23 family metallopeptidase [Anaerovoracaceae bacterium]
MKKQEKRRRRQNKLLKKAVLAATLPTMLFLLLVIIMLCMLASFMPSAAVSVVDDYKTAAELAGCTWQELLVYDTVRFENDFENADPYVSAVDFMKMYYENWRKPEDSGWEMVSSGNLNTAEGIRNWFGLGADSDINDVLKAAKEKRKVKNRRKSVIIFSAKELDDLIIEKGFDEEQIQWADMLMTSGALEEMFGDVYNLPDYIESVNGGFFGWPTPELQTVTSKFDQKRMHPTLHVIRPHNGVDISGANAMGSPVVAIEEGKVIQVDTSGGERGINIRVQHNIKGDIWISRYQHLSAVKCEVGDKVQKGTVIGAVGNTGIGTGPHLHLELTFNGVLIDPLPLIQGGN